MLRWTHTCFIPQPGVLEEYFNPARPLDMMVTTTPEDIIVPQNETTLQRLWHLFNWIVRYEDLVDEDESSSNMMPFANRRTPKRDSENRPPTWAERPSKRPKGEFEA